MTPLNTSPNAGRQVPRVALGAVLGAALGAAVLAVVMSGVGAVPDSSLVQLHVLFRHGARTPVSSYPNDPYKGETYAPYGIGHLTRRGRYMEFALGQWLRARYVGSFLSEEYYTGAARVNTSYVERTQESAAASMAGLWPPGRQQAWGDTALGQLWMPIPYHSLRKHEDRALAGTVTCPARDQEVARFQARPVYKHRILAALGGANGVHAEEVGAKAVLAKGLAVLRYVEKHSGIVYDEDPSSLYAVFSALQCQEDLNMTLPEWSRAVYPEPLRSAAHIWLQSFSATPLLRRLSYGDLPAWILASSRRYESEPPLQAYSAHDSTVSAAIQIFHLEPQDKAGEGIPEFSAALVFELRRNASGTLGYEIFYRRELHGPVVRMVPRGCAAFCPLEQLQQLVALELPSDQDSCTGHDKRLQGSNHVLRGLSPAT